MLRNDQTCGFFTFAQNTNTVDYTRLAYGLALSLKYSQNTISNLSIGITPGTKVDRKYAWAFDNIIEIPWSDMAENSEWKLENEWKAPFMSPYDHTIKLDCDMLFLNDIGSWWDKLISGSNEIVWTNSVVDWRGQPVIDDFYRKVFTANKLPNIYTGLGYFRKTASVFDFFHLSEIITNNWSIFFDLFLTPQTRPTYFSTDVAFALAAKLCDLDQTFSKIKSLPTFTHMKARVQGWDFTKTSENWQDQIPTMLTPDGMLKIGTHLQRLPLHYHIKEFLTDDIINTYERLISK